MYIPGAHVMVEGGWGCGRGELESWGGESWRDEVIVEYCMHTSGHYRLSVMIDSVVCVN